MIAGPTVSGDHPVQAESPSDADYVGGDDDVDPFASGPVGSTGLRISQLCVGAAVIGQLTLAAFAVPCMDIR